MKVKALDHVEDANQKPEADDNGGYVLRTIVTVMKAGEVYELEDSQAQRLIKMGVVSTDMDADLLPHLIPAS